LANSLSSYNNWRNCLINWLKILKRQIITEKALFTNDFEGLNHNTRVLLISLFLLYRN